jgi:hypothetical protein
MTTDLLLWLAIKLCDPLNSAEALVPKDMPNSQLIEQYWVQQPASESACHWLLWKQALSKEIAFRLAQQETPK